MASTYSNLDYTTSTGYDAHNTTASSADTAAAMGVFGAFMVVYIIFLAAVYIYMALALSTIAKKTNTPNTWMAWVPIANFVLMLNIAKKPTWWIILMFIPVANLVVMIIMWMAIAEARHKPNWLGLLLLVPGANMVMPGYLAWSK